MTTKKYSIKGMHCRSCEILIEEELGKINGVNKVEANFKDSTATVHIKDSSQISDSTVNEALKSCGYSLGTNDDKWFSSSMYDYYTVMKALLAFVIVYFVLLNTGFLKNAGTNITNVSSYSIVLLIGITAGFSTCMALVGGLVLGISAKNSNSSRKNTFTKLIPHFYFNIGRVVFFAFFGAIIAFIGSVIKFNPALNAVITVMVALYMLVIGLQLLNLFPVLSKIQLTLPKTLSKKIGVLENNKFGPFILGGLTFFIPCGFTQAMQIYSMTSGKPLVGALTMGIFALGTAPGLLSIGGIVSAIKGNFANTFFRFVAICVIALAIFNMSGALKVLNLGQPNNVSNNNNQAEVKAYNPNDVQEIHMTQTYQGYSPNSFTLKKGVPVKWIVNSKDSYSCASSIVSRQLGINKTLTAGENVIEFTPKTAGKIAFSCSMGMYTGSFNVVEN